MKYIKKREAPHELRIWFIDQPVNEDGERINCSYKDDMPSPVKAAVKQSLLVEQGYLCCYTGIRISGEQSHIEHLKPQHLCENNEDIDYSNLVAAYPGVNQQRCPFGAHAKDKWYDTSLFVNPLTESCESRFRFDQFGMVKPANESDLAARETITRLGLDHKSLTEMRRQAIEEALYYRKKPLSEKKLTGIIERYCTPDLNSNEMRPFCFVVQQAAKDLFERKKKRRAQRQFSKKKQHK